MKQKQCQKKQQNISREWYMTNGLSSYKQRKLKAIVK